MAETETANIMIRVMNNVDVAFVGAVAGFALSKMTGRRRRNNMMM